MITKVVNFLLAYTLITIRFLIIVIPILLCFYPIAAIMGFSIMDILHSSLPIILGALFFINVYVILYLILDMIFGISLKRITRDKCMKCVDVPKFSWIMPLFETTKKIFYHNNVELYIKINIDEVNAYAIGNPHKDNIILTTGLLEHIDLSAHNQLEKEVAVAGILAHEMSHIINRDFLPGLLIWIHQEIMNVLFKICWVLVKTLSVIISIVPILGGMVSKILMLYYESLNRLGNILFKVLLKIYDYMRIHFLRSIEYRSDREAAKAFGGDSIGLALSFLKGGYNSIFSTHPSTPSRLKKIANVPVGNGYIKPHIINSLINFISIAIIFLLTLAIAIELRIWILPQIIAHGFNILYSRLYGFGAFLYFIYEKIKAIVKTISWMHNMIS